MPTPSREARSLNGASTQKALRLSNGRTLWAKSWPGRGTPLVLLHGMLDCADGWDELAASTSRPRVAFDLPGFGGSGLPSPPRVSAYAEDVLVGVEQLGLPRYVLVGHSVGGAVATASAPADREPATMIAGTAENAIGVQHPACTRPGRGAPGS